MCRFVDQVQKDLLILMSSATPHAVSGAYSVLPTHQSNSALSPTAPSPSHSTPVSPEEAQQLFMDEVTSLLLENKAHKLSVEHLSRSYYQAFGRQINLKQLGCTSVSQALHNLPNVKVRY